MACRGVIYSFWEKRKINVSVEKYWTCLSIMSLTLPKTHESCFQRGDFRNHHIFLKAQCFLPLPSPLHCHTVWRANNVSVCVWVAHWTFLAGVHTIAYSNNWPRTVFAKLSWYISNAFEFYAPVKLHKSSQFWIKILLCAAQYFEGIWVFVLTSYELFNQCCFPDKNVVPVSVGTALPLALPGLGQLTTKVNKM